MSLSSHPKYFFEKFQNWPIWPALGLLLAFGCMGGFTAWFAGLPLPFMIGSLLASAGFVFWMGRFIPDHKIQFPERTRMSVIALVGAMIGAGFGPDLLRVLPSIWPAALAMLVFVPLAHLGCFLLYRFIGGYSKIDAVFCATPGGLMESIELGTAAGGSTMLITMQHFIRIIIVVVAIPFLFFIVTGEAVGSASGQSMAQSISHWYDIPALIVLGAIGLGLARYIHLPAGHLMGPMIISAAAHALGLLDLSAPTWLLSLCQLIIGVSLGLRFAGMRLQMLAKGLGLSLITVAYMLVLAVGFALLLDSFVPTGFAAMFISFAPGGVIEMGLVALSLSLSPVIVAGLHLLRIVLAVSFLIVLTKRFHLA